MRKFILPILVAGAVAFTAASAFADANTHTGSFQEDHANGTSLFGGAVTSSLSDTTPWGDHYKVTSATEAGAHGMGYQIDSGLLKQIANGVKDGDAFWGYTTGADPFVKGFAGANGDGSSTPVVAPDLGSTDPDVVGYVLPAPAYTLPCPEWISGGSMGTCPANASATDPQTWAKVNIWDGTVLDDLYQTVGVDDSTAGPGGVGSYERILDQTIDQLFYAGKRGTVYYDDNKNGLFTGSKDKKFSNGKIGNTTIGGTERIVNIDDTLDQDVADIYKNTTSGQTLGIFNKLALSFQFAGKQLTEGEMNALGYTTTHGFGGGAGCSSWGGGSNSGSPDCIALKDGESLGGTTFYDLLSEEVDAINAMSQAQDPEGDVANWTKDFAAVAIDQFIMSEVYDWTVPSDINGKLTGEGMKSEYWSWFRDGTHKDYVYEYKQDSGHGKVTLEQKKVDHGDIDP